MSVVKTIFGLQDPKYLNDQQIIKASKKFKVDQKSNYRMDSVYFDFFIQLDTARFKSQRKNHLQPLQALYFNSKGELVRFYINCYAGGFPNIKWNRNGNMEFFLPKNQAPLDTLLDFNTERQFLKPVCKETEERQATKADYYVVVYWNKCTKRHSKRLIRTVKNNVQKAKGQTVEILYVNYDNILYKLEKRKN